MNLSQPLKDTEKGNGFAGAESDHSQFFSSKPEPAAIYQEADVEAAHGTITIPVPDTAVSLPSSIN
jgi:hypothetical protein